MKIELIMDDKNLDLNESIKRLHQIESEVKNSCSLEEQNLILITTSIGKNSLRYWHDNLNEWTSTLEDIYDLPTRILRRWFSWKAVAKNDVAYGAGGAVAGAIVGGSVTMGAATIPGYVAGGIGGAVGGSVGNAALQVLDRIWR